MFIIKNAGIFSPLSLRGLSDTETKTKDSVYVVGQNEIQVKMKFLRLSTLIIHGSLIIGVR